MRANVQATACAMRGAAAPRLPPRSRPVAGSPPSFSIRAPALSAAKRSDSPHGAFHRRTNDTKALHPVNILSARIGACGSSPQVAGSSRVTASAPFRRSSRAGDDDADFVRVPVLFVAVRLTDDGFARSRRVFMIAAEFLRARSSTNIVDYLTSCSSPQWWSEACVVPHLDHPRRCGDAALELVCIRSEDAKDDHSYVFPSYWSTSCCISVGVIASSTPRLLILSALGFVRSDMLPSERRLRYPHAGARTVWGRCAGTHSAAATRTNCWRGCPILSRVLPGLSFRSTRRFNSCNSGLSLGRPRQEPRRFDRSRPFRVSKDGGRGIHLIDTSTDDV